MVGRRQMGRTAGGFGEAIDLHEITFESGRGLHQQFFRNW